MGETLDTKKIRLVKHITAVQDEAFLDFLEKLFERTKGVGDDLGKKGKNKSSLSLTGNEALAKVLEPIEEKIDLQKILLEQNYRGPDKRRFKRLVKELDIKEPIENLLAMLTK